MLSKHLLNELKEILKEEYSLELDEDSVQEIGNTLAGYYDLLSRMDSGIENAQQKGCQIHE